MTRLLPIGALATTLALSTASMALGDSAIGATPGRNAEAEAHIARGLELRRQRLDERALAEFRAAYALEQSDAAAEGASDVGITERALAQIALAEDALGLWVEAEEAFERVLADHSDAWVEKRRAQLSDELSVLRAHLSEVELEITPATGAGAEVLINGAVAHHHAGSDAFRVVSGRVLIEVKAPGFEVARRLVEVTPGSHARQTIALTPIVPVEVPPPLAVESAPPRIAAIPFSLSAPSTSSSRVAPKTNLPRLFALSSLGVAGAAFVTGTVGAIARTVAVNNYNDNSRCDYGGVPRSTRCAGVASDVDRFTTVMTVGYVASAVSALAGGILAFTFPRDIRVDVTEAGKTGLMLWAERSF